MTTLIKNGTVIDPANKVHARLNLMVYDGKIALCTREEPAADRVIDAQGKIVAPGFIDVGMHEGGLNSDGSPDMDVFLAELRMGITTALGGYCGSNACDSPAQYLDLFDRTGGPVHLGLFAGHTTARLRAGGENKYGPLDGDTARNMLQNLEEALTAGCAGVSLAMKQTPGTTFNELLEVGSLCKKTGKPLSVRIREDAAGAPDAVREVAELARLLGIPMQISCIGAAAGYGQMEAVLGMLDEYRMNGTKIGIDCAPYDAFSAEIGETVYDEGWLERYRASYDRIELCDGPYRGSRCTEELFHRLRREAPRTLTLCHVVLAQEVELALTHPNGIPVTDGWLRKGQGNPGAESAFSRFLRQFARTGGLTLDEAVAKLSALPAEQFRLTGKGRLNVGADADLVIFDPDNVSGEPVSSPCGVEAVLVGGETALWNGQVENAALGRVLHFL